jgi:hypothetical protein
MCYDKVRRVNIILNIGLWMCVSTLAKSEIINIFNLQIIKYTLKLYG